VRGDTVPQRQSWCSPVARNGPVHCARTAVVRTVTAVGSILGSAPFALRETRMRKAPVGTGLLAAVLLAVVPSAGCSASDSPTGASTPEATDTVLDEPVVEQTPTTPEPCGLVTPDQVSAALGEPVEAGVDMPGGLPGQ
jgi:hypothetical protein